MPVIHSLLKTSKKLSILYILTIQLYAPVGGRPAHLAVADFCLCIKKGEIFGLLGP
jgi:ABC-type multidrug transport system ATPase subunit